MNWAKKSALGLVVIVSAFAQLAQAQQQPVPLSVKKLTEDVYWTQGGADRHFRQISSGKMADG